MKVHCLFEQSGTFKSENSFYSDGNLTGDMLYEDFMERKTGE